MAEKLAPPGGELFLRKGRESLSSLELDRLSPGGEAAGEESSDSDGEQEGGSHRLIRKVSTSGQMRTKVSTRWRIGTWLGHLPVCGASVPPQGLPWAADWLQCCLVSKARQGSVSRQSGGWGPRVCTMRGCTRKAVHVGACGWDCPLSAGWQVGSQAKGPKGLPREA